MQKRLNIAKANDAMQIAGLTQSSLAEHLGVSKEAVSQWLNHKAFPRPNKLLKLGKILKLPFDELVVKDDPFEPKIAFRKARGTKTTEYHIAQAKEKGLLLRRLVPYLSFDLLEAPPVLKTPSCDYDYLQKVAAKIRGDINLSLTDIVDFSHLIRRFRDLQTVVIPVLWGSKNRHENAVHIYLPDTQTTWVYLNLDTNVHDFKFWMAHELGHCLSPQLEGDEAENFADAFAASVLFPQAMAEIAYSKISSEISVGAKIKSVLSFAQRQTISPYTVLGEINKYANHVDKPEIDLGKGFYGAITNFNKGFHNLSNAIFMEGLNSKEGKPQSNEYIAKLEQVFDTPIFQLLRRYLKETGKSAGFVQTLLDMPLLDARSIHKELT